MLRGKTVPALGLAVLCVAGVAFGGNATPRVRYDGHRVVRVELSSEAELETMRSISTDCWAEAIGIGTLDFRVDPDEFERLRRTGLPFEVVIDDVQVALDAELTRLAQPAAAGSGWFDDFKDLAAINARLQEFTALYPDLTEMIDVGDSVEERDIWALRITGPGEDKPAVLYNATQHAREWIAPMVSMYVAEALLDGYGSDQRITALVDAVEIFVIPVVNPDGYVWSWDVERYWRKNRRDNGDGTKGVDLNRNWGYEWGGPGSSSDPNDPLYRGPAPFSEPETQAMAALYAAHPNIVASIDFHSKGEQVLYPWAFQAVMPDDEGRHGLLGSAMRSDILSVNGSTYELGSVAILLYLASGGSVDWSWGDQGVLSYTIELPGDDFVLPAEEIIPSCTENLAAALTMAEVAATGVMFRFPGALPRVVAALETTEVEVDIAPITSGPLNLDSGWILSRIAGDPDFTASPLTPVGGDRFAGLLPAAECGTTIEYSFQIQTALGATASSPLAAPDEWYEAQALEIEIGFDDDFEGDLGWTVESESLTDGAWDRGVPAGAGDRGDPLFDFDGSGACYLTDNVAGNSDVDGGPTRLTSPAIDLTGLEDPRLTYARWFTNDDDDEDTLDVEISADDGGEWTLIESIGNEGGWTLVDVRVADHLAPTATMRVRFSATDNPNDSVTEAAVDAVRFYEAGCASVLGDVDGDGDCDFKDLIQVLSHWGPCPGTCPADLDGSGDVDFGDLLEVLSNWS